MSFERKQLRTKRTELAAKRRSRGTRGGGGLKADVVKEGGGGGLPSVCELRRAKCISVKASRSVNGFSKATRSLLDLQTLRMCKARVRAINQAGLN